MGNSRIILESATTGVGEGGAVETGGFEKNSRIPGWEVVSRAGGLGRILDPQRGRGLKVPAWGGDGGALFSTVNLKEHRSPLLAFLLGARKGNAPQARNLCLGRSPWSIQVSVQIVDDLIKL